MNEEQRALIGNTGLFWRLLDNLKPDLVVFSGSDKVLGAEFVKKHDFREVASHHDAGKRSYLRLLERGKDGLRLFFGSNDRIGPFGRTTDELLAGKIGEWSLKR